MPTLKNLRIEVENKRSMQLVVVANKTHRQADAVWCSAAIRLTAVLSSSLSRETRPVHTRTSRSLARACARCAWKRGNAAAPQHQFSCNKSENRKLNVKMVKLVVCQILAMQMVGWRTHTHFARVCQPVNGRSIDRFGSASPVAIARAYFFFFYPLHFWFLLCAALRYFPSLLFFCFFQNKQTKATAQSIRLPSTMANALPCQCTYSRVSRESRIHAHRVYFAYVNARSRRSFCRFDRRLDSVLCTFSRPVIRSASRRPLLSRHRRSIFCGVAQSRLNMLERVKASQSHNHRCDPVN